MMKTRHLLAGTSLLLAVAVSSAAAQDWVEFARGETGFIDYYDSSSIRRIGDEVEVWTMSNHSGDRTVPYTRAKRRYLVRCNAHTAALTAYISYARDGTVLASETVPPGEVDHAAISPGSTGARLIEVACPNTIVPTRPRFPAPTPTPTSSQRWELIIRVTPHDGSEPLIATNTYTDQAACQAALSEMLARAQRIARGMARSEGRCSEVVTQFGSDATRGGNLGPVSSGAAESSVARTAEPCRQLAQGMTPTGTVIADLGRPGADPLDLLLRRMVELVQPRSRDQFETTAEYEGRVASARHAGLRAFQNVPIQTALTETSLRYNADSEVFLLDARLFSIDRETHYQLQFGEIISPNVRLPVPRDEARAIYEAAREYNRMSVISVISLVEPLLELRVTGDAIVHEVKAELLCLAIRDTRSNQNVIFIDRPQVVERPLF